MLCASPVSLGPGSFRAALLDSRWSGQNWLNVILVGVLHYDASGRQRRFNMHKGRSFDRDFDDSTVVKYIHPATKPLGCLVLCSHSIYHT